MITRRVLTTLAAATATLALGATPALASGGSGGGSGGGGGGGGGGAVTQPAPLFDAWTLCPDYANVGTIPLAEGSTTFANVVSDTACVVVRSQAGVLSLYSVAVAPGWTYSVKSAGGGSSNKVDIDFTNAATGAKHSFMTEPGKLVIR